MQLVVGLWTEQLDVCCGQVVSNAWEENIFAPSILKIVDDSSKPNHIICLGDVLHRKINLNIIKKSARKGVKPNDSRILHTKGMFSKELP